MVVRLSGGAGSAPKRRQSAPKPLNAQRVAVTRPFNPATNPGRNAVTRPFRPAPAYNPPAAYRQPVQPAPAPQQMSYPIQQPSGYGTVGGPQMQVSGGEQFSGASSFAEPSAPPPRRVLDKDSWLAGDADYKEQTNEYDRAIKEFRSRISAKKANFEKDYDQSKGVTEQNQNVTMDNLGEDFGARGLSYSGMFDKSREQTGDQFKRQLSNLVQMKTRNIGQADEQMADYDTENRLSRANAMRQALARMAQQQAIIDMGG